MAKLQITIDVDLYNDDMWFRYLEFEGNWIVDWGDGCVEVNKESHTYERAGLHKITIKGDFKVIGTVESNNIVSIDKEEDSGISLFYPLYLGRV